MALFNKNSKKEEATKATGGTETLDWVIKKPRVTEKAAMVSGDNVYTFDVAPRANKIQIKQAVAKKYGVTPLSVNIVNARARKEMKRGRLTHQKRAKKAMVKLKKGESIELA